MYALVCTHCNAVPKGKIYLQLVLDCVSGEEGLGPLMEGPENDEVSNSLVMKEEKYEAPFMRARLRRGLQAGS